MQKNSPFSGREWSLNPGFPRYFLMEGKFNRGAVSRSMSVSNASALVFQNTDSALLPCISYPAFAVDDDALYSQTLDKIVRKLKGKYGFKRFLRDGYRTTNEDKNRRHYKPAEMKVSVVSISAEMKKKWKERENEKRLFPHIWHEL